MIIGSACPLVKFPSSQFSKKCRHIYFQNGTYWCSCTVWEHHILTKIYVIIFITDQLFLVCMPGNHFEYALFFCRCLLFYPYCSTPIPGGILFQTRTNHLHRHVLRTKTFRCKYYKKVVHYRYHDVCGEDAVQ